MPQQSFLAALLGGQLALIALDLLDSRRHRTERYGGDRLRPRYAVFLGVTILFYGILQYAGLALVPTGEELLATAQAALWTSPAASGSGPPPASVAILLGVGSFYVAGFWDYIVHRFINHSRPLWFSHEYHHLPTQVTVYMPGICVRPLAFMAVLPATAATVFTVCLALRLAGLDGVDLHGVLQSVVLAQVTILGTSHSSFLRRFAWLHRALKPFGITTPREHWLHHTPDLQGNFGNFTTLWDRVLGTYLDPLDPACQGRRAGLGYDQDFLGALTLGRLKLSPALRDYFGVRRYCHLEPADATPAGVARAPLTSRSPACRQDPRAPERAESA